MRIITTWKKVPGLRNVAWSDSKDVAGYLEWSPDLILFFKAKDPPRIYESTKRHPRVDLVHVPCILLLHSDSRVKTFV